MSDLEQRLRLRLTLDLHAALKSRNSTRVSALRSLLAALDNAQAIPLAELPARSPLCGATAEVPRKTLSDAQLVALFAAELDERRTAAMMLEKHGSHEEAERLRAELAVLDDYSGEFRLSAAALGD